MPPIIRTENVRKSYVLPGRTVEAVRGVSLQIDEPGFYAIMGPSGSGKSTLLHLLAALDRPDTGEIEVGGQRIDALSETELTRYRRRGIGLVFQQFNLIPTLTAIDNVALPAMLDGVDATERTARAAELLERLGLGQRMHHRPDAMSGGEQQRVAIARALSFKPPVVFADEPTGSLDSATSRELWSLLGELAEQQGTTILMVTHEPEAASHCERVLLLRDGTIADTFDVEGLDAAGLAARAQRALG
ncbi:MAG: ABC transporter ATP-binding protein [Phycisphaerales bacterium]